jgi:hypothetical protein
VIGGFPPQRNHLRTAHLSGGGYSSTKIGTRWELQPQGCHCKRYARWIYNQKRIYLHGKHFRG